MNNEKQVSPEKVVEILSSRIAQLETQVAMLQARNQELEEGASAVDVEPPKGSKK